MVNITDKTYKTGKVFEVNVRLAAGSGDDDAELVFCVLENIGISREDLSETIDKGRTRISFYAGTAAKAHTALEAIDSAGLRNVRSSVKRLGPEDWRDKWKKVFKPFKITSNITVVPSWDRGKYREKGSEIFIDTGLAFGSGLHPTTRHTAKLIASLGGKFEDILDIGTGTGILALVAWKYGARRIWAMDIDPESTKATLKNFQENGCKAELVMTAPFEKFSKKGKFDLVAANLITKDLVTLKKGILDRVRPGKYLVVSGISLDNYGFFRKNFDSPRLRCLKAVREKGWAAVLYRVGA